MAAKTRRELTAPVSPYKPFTMPFIDAIYIPGLNPVLGKPYFEAPTSRVDTSTFATLALKADQIAHEILHLQIRRGSLGLLMRDIAIAMNIILYNLSDTATLRIPSWRIVGSPALSAISEKLPPLLHKLSAHVMPVEETLCAVMTLGWFRMLHARRNLSYDGYLKVEEGTKNSLLNLHPGTWQQAQQLLQYYPSHLSWDNLIYFLTLLQGIIRYCFGGGTPTSTISEWLESGVLPEKDTPFYKLNTILEYLQQARIHDAADAVRSLEQAQFFNVLTRLEQTNPHAVSIRWVNNLTNRWATSKVLAALDMEFPEALLVHPITKADTVVTLGRVAVTRNEIKDFVTGKTDTMYFGNFAKTCGSFGLLTWQNGAFQCKHALRVLGGATIPYYTGLKSILEPVSVPLIASRLEQLKVRKAPQEMELLWNMERIRNQLMDEKRLECLCGTVCTPAAGCACTELVARIYKHTRLDNGRHLRKVPCLVAV